MRKFYLSLTFILFSSAVFSQVLFKKGYIITLDNDTVYGELNEESRNIGSFIHFWIPGKEKIKYEASDIKGYSIENVNSCMSVKTHAGTGFGKILVDGYYRLVYVEMYSEPEWSVGPASTNGKTTHSLGYGSELLYSNYKIYRGEEDLFYVSKKTFKGRTAEFFSDYPHLSEQIKKKKLKFKDLELIVQEYNKWKSKNLLNL